MQQQYFMGFDFSTQRIKLVVIDGEFQCVYEDSVVFDDLSHYNTSGGCHISGSTVTAPTVMWVEALDVLMARVQKNGVDLSRVQALSGAGQQHGSVYWKNGAANLLSNLSSLQTLKEQLKDAFSVENSPIWMDSSTSPQCRELEKSVGGAIELARLTGAEAFERYTGNQIMKISQQMPEAYRQTERICLVSNFAASLFLGKYADIDESDASGMNLMNIETRQWEERLCELCGAELIAKLGQIVPTASVLGTISQYFVNRYGFSENCQVTAFTGDNPASLAGMRVCENDVAVSLGSSDTLFLSLEKARPSLGSQVLANPINSAAFMAMITFKNGSLTRENIRDEYAAGSWDKFNSMIAETPIGNNGNIGFYFKIKEITPNIQGCFLFDSEGNDSELFSPATHVRAILEGQLLLRRVHAESLGLQITSQSRILSTGGASSNPAILQILSDVFNAPVFTQDVPNSASLGAAYLAMHTVKKPSDDVNFFDRLVAAASFKKIAEPQEDAAKVYDAMADRCKKLENRIVERAANA